jgi:hypothetical protein
MGNVTREQWKAMGKINTEYDPPDEVKMMYSPPIVAITMCMSVASCHADGAEATRFVDAGPSNIARPIGGQGASQTCSRPTQVSGGVALLYCCTRQS